MVAICPHLEDVYNRASDWIYNLAMSSQPWTVIRFEQSMCGAPSSSKGSPEAVYPRLKVCRGRREVSKEALGGKLVT